ncbi:MAG: hypothetical protein IJW83_00475 [Clostridia bacterium]|nr:hypothetical protein [Clostridia bacterium]
MSGFKEKSEKKCEILAKIRKIQIKNTLKMVGVRMHRCLGKKAVKTMKNLPYGMLSALLKTKKENPK